MAYWIDYGNDKIGHSIRCSSCGEDFGKNQWLTKYWYCPNCGKPMDVEGDEEVKCKRCVHNEVCYIVRECLNYIPDFKCNYFEEKQRNKKEGEENG